MRNRDHGTGVLLQVLFEPEHTLGVKVVRGLVEQQQVGLLQQQARERDAATLTTREVLHHGVGGRRAQRVHGLFELVVEIPTVNGVDLLLQRAHLGEQRVEVGVGLGHEGRDLVESVELRLDGDALFDVLQHRLGLVEFGLLHQDADGKARGEGSLAVGRGVEPRHDLQDRRLTGAVRADHTDLRAGKERHCDVIENELFADRLARANHLINVFSHDGSSLPGFGVSRLRDASCSRELGTPDTGTARSALPVDGSGLADQAYVLVGADRRFGDGHIAAIGRDELPDETALIDAHRDIHAVGGMPGLALVEAHLHIVLVEARGHHRIDDRYSLKGRIALRIGAQGRVEVRQVLFRAAAGHELGG